MDHNTITTGDCPVDEWAQCYSASWRDLIVPAAFAHPAKMARGLLKRILAHAFEEGWVKPGGVVLDPMAGIFTTGIMGAYENLNVIGIELEPRFYLLAQANIALHAAKWKILGCPPPVIIQGDSRELCKILSERNFLWKTKELTITPTMNTEKVLNHNAKKKHNGVSGQDYTQPDLILSSPPYAGALGNRQHEGNQHKYYERQKRYNEAHPEYKRPEPESMCYPCSDGNLAAMKPGSVDAVLSSPPFQESLQSGDTSSSFKSKYPNAQTGGDWGQTYGNTPGNLGNLKLGAVDLICSSPPYEGSMTAGGHLVWQNQGKVGAHKESKGKEEIYGSTANNLGNTQGDTFWGAAKIIIQQCHQILKEGGVAIWIAKRFVRAGKIVEFSQDWARLCESVGFEVVCWHKAMLVKETVDDGLFGHKIVKKTERKSFFRRLAEAKNSPRIDWEDVICMRSRRAAPR